MSAEIQTALERLRRMRSSLVGAVNRELRHDRAALEVAIAALEVVPLMAAALEVQPAQEGGGWRDLASAPKAETDTEPPICILLLWWNRTESGGRDFACGEGYWLPDGDGGAWWWANTAPGDYYHSPIHESITGRVCGWHPLPAVPPPMGVSS